MNMGMRATCEEWGSLCSGKCLRWGRECPVRAVRQESYSFKSLRPRRRIFTECLLSVIKRSQLYFYCPNLVKQFSGVKTKEQQCRMGGGVRSRPWCFRASSGIMGWRRGRERGGCKPFSWAVQPSDGATAGKAFCRHCLTELVKLQEICTNYLPPSPKKMKM